MKGNIYLTSIQGTGSRFICTLPLLSEIEESQVNSEQKPSKSAIDIPPDINILIVEDNPNNRKVVELYLKSYKWNLDFAENSQEGVNLCRNKNYDIILMDLEMPVMDGYDAVIKIRQICSHKKNQ